MIWLPVISLPGGTTVAIPMPSREDLDDRQLHRYRVQSSTSVQDFASMREVIDHLLDPQSPHREALLEMSTFGAPARDPRAG